MEQSVLTHLHLVESSILENVTIPFAFYAVFVSDSNFTIFTEITVVFVMLLLLLLFFL